MENFLALREELVTHFKTHALRTDGPFTLSSGATSHWYLDGRKTTYDGVGGRLVGRCVGHVIDPAATAVGGLTMGADPVAISTALLSERHLKSFSVRPTAKAHGAGGRLVGPVGHGDRAVVIDDTTTTGASLVSAVEALRAEGVAVIQAVVIVDRSEGAAAKRMAGLGVPFQALLEPADLGVAPR